VEVATAAAAAGAVAPAVEDSILVRERSAVVVPLTSIAGEWVSQVGARGSQVRGRGSQVGGWGSLRRVLDRCGLRFNNPILPQGVPGVIAG
jgi:hypothetical protein